MSYMFTGFIQLKIKNYHPKLNEKILFHNILKTTILYFPKNFIINLIK